MGDSYTAGPLVPIQTGKPVGCLRSTNNYPALVAKGLAVTTAQDVSCSGATTADLAAPQRTGLGTNAAQLDALGADVSLVTLGIGGNDIGFVSIIAECATRSPLEPTGAACRDHYAETGGDELTRGIEGLVPTSPAAPAPPTAAGMRGMADAVLGSLAPSANVA